MNNGKQPVTPTMYTKVGDGEDDYQPLKDGQKTGWERKFGGLTKREYFAAKAMQALVADHHLTYEQVAEMAVRMSDAILLELEKQKE